MGVYTTEITSDAILSDNPLHQRLLKAYIAAVPYINGDVLEPGCGEGRGIEYILSAAKSYTAIDKIKPVVDRLSEKYPDQTFLSEHFPPFPFSDESFDTVVTFQVIEHIRNDDLFIKEIYRVLRPGGTAIITTPNILMTLSRNPWHIREYRAQELTALAKNYFKDVEMKGIAGNQKVLDYHDQNRKSVARIMRFDVLNLQYKLPAPLLRLPYEILNRLNRNKLKKADERLVASISHDDFKLKPQDDQNLDLFCILRK